MDSKPRLGKPIRKLRKHLGLTQEEFAQRIGLTDKAVSQWENGHTDPAMPTLLKIVDAFDVNLAYFGITSEAAYLPPKARPIGDSPYATMPLLGRIHAGDPSEPIESDTELQIPSFVKQNHPRGYMLTVEGSCMDRVYPPGCHIVIDPDTEPHNGSIAAVQLDGGDALMRRLYRGASTLVLSPDSTDGTIEDIVITGDTVEVRLLGTVVWFQAAEEME